MTFVATWVGLTTIIVFGIFGLVGLIALLVYLYKQGRLEGTSWKFWLALFIIVALLRACFATPS